MLQLQACLNVALIPTVMLRVISWMHHDTNMEKAIFSCENLYTSDVVSSNILKQIIKSTKLVSHDAHSRLHKQASYITLTGTTGEKIIL